MTDAELETLLLDLESDRSERKSSYKDSDKIRQAVCAFANDLPDHRKPGVVFVGVHDDGRPAGLEISDEVLVTLASIRSDGNILPFPTMKVWKKTLAGAELAVIIVEPADAPPVKYKGRVWIRVGPRRATATREEERRLAEKRRTNDLPFDLWPARPASLDDLDIELFKRSYLPAALPMDVLEANERSLEHQLMAVRFITAQQPYTPTVLGLLVLGRQPTSIISGAYIQFLRIDGTRLTDPIANQKEFTGPLPEMLHALDDLLKVNISTRSDITSGTIEVRRPDYPLTALQQLTRNALMHRNYESSNAPVRITWFSDRIEIQNPGGPYGQVTRNNFGHPGITDYRNPNLAAAMKELGYVQRFGVGIALSRQALEENGNPKLEFQVEDNHIAVIIRRSP
jgi:ATP-dependent DNA helicase RecG